MTCTHFNKPHHPNKDLPEEFGPGAPPVDPDEGPIPAPVPEDPEYDRAINPGANGALQAQFTSHLVEVAVCP